MQLSVIGDQIALDAAFSALLVIPDKLSRSRRFQLYPIGIDRVEGKFGAFPGFFALQLHFFLKAFGIHTQMLFFRQQQRQVKREAIGIVERESLFSGDKVALQAGADFVKALQTRIQCVIEPLFLRLDHHLDIGFLA